MNGNDPLKAARRAYSDALARGDDASAHLARIRELEAAKRAA